MDLYPLKTGHSKHQIGLTMDVSSKGTNNELELSFAKNKERC